MGSAAAAAPHLAYAGDSVLGNDVNLDAGTKLANFKIVPGRESIVYPGASLHGTIPAGSVVTRRPGPNIKPRPRR